MMSTGEVISLFSDGTNKVSPKKVIIDDTGAIAYFGWTTSDAATSDKEWFIVRENVVGGVASYDLPKLSNGNSITGQSHVWDDRATLTY